MRKDLKKYINYRYKKVEGWYSGMALKIIARLADIQKRNNIVGPVCEIGVHQGRSFILLHMLTNTNEFALAYDLFKKQTENMDKSGEGDKDKFIRNLKKNKCDLQRIKIISTNSLNLTPETMIIETKSLIRIFSIDGGHTAPIVFNDLGLAEKTICMGGIIIVDDVFHEGWPGVAEATCKYLSSGNSKLIPFAIFDNKMVFTNNEIRKEIYLNSLRSLSPKFLTRESEFFSTKVVIIEKSTNKMSDKLRRRFRVMSLKGSPSR